MTIDMWAYSKLSVKSSDFCVYPSEVPTLSTAVVVASFEIGKCESFNFVLFQDYSGSSGSLAFPQEF